MKYTKYLITAVLLSLVVALTPRSTVASNSSHTQSKNHEHFVIKIESVVRDDKKAFTVSFSKLKHAQRIRYALTYKGDGVEQGAEGKVFVHDEKIISRDFVFGTCSGSTCHYYDTVTDVVLRVTVRTEDGRLHTKTFPVNLN